MGPNCQHRVIKDGSYFPHLHQTSQVSKVIQEFILKVEQKNVSPHGNIKEFIKVLREIEEDNKITKLGAE